MKKIICAFSGGPDSVFLAKFLEKNFSEYEVIIAHFNHHLRGEESDGDEKFCEAFAKKNNVTFEKGDWETPIPSEEKARNARYLFLESVRKKFSAQWICTGHHKDDVAETVLLQFLRGGGLPALAGIAEKNKEKFLWRPLLQISKQEILEHLEKNFFSYRFDSSNAKNIYTRNFLRNNIFPQLEEKFPKFSDRIAQKTKYFSDLQDILELLAKKFVTKNFSNPDQGIEKNIFFEEKFPIRCEVLKILFPSASWTFQRFEQVENFLQEGKSGKIFAMKGLKIQIFGEKFFL